MTIRTRTPVLYESKYRSVVSFSMTLAGTVDTFVELSFKTALALFLGNGIFATDGATWRHHRK